MAIDLTNASLEEIQSAYENAENTKSTAAQEAEKLFKTGYERYKAQGVNPLTLDLTQRLNVFQCKSYEEMLGKNAQAAQTALMGASTQQKNQALRNVARLIAERKDTIIAENKKDLAKAQVALEKKEMEQPIYDRLVIGEKKLQSMIDSLNMTASLPDPVGAKKGAQSLETGIELDQQKDPIGPIIFIYESRPDVTIEAPGIGIKSGNPMVLKGGNEAINSNKILAKIFQDGLEEAGLPRTCVQVVEAQDRITGRTVSNLALADTDHFALGIPRGGKGLVKVTNEKAKIAILSHLDGNCHQYVDKEANVAKALAIVDNSKNDNYSVCNALETLIVHEDIMEKYLIDQAKIFSVRGVTMHCDEKAFNFLSKHKVEGLKLELATEKDWEKEYLSPDIAVKTVSSMEEALEHIHTYGSNHTDSIITENGTTANNFKKLVRTAFCGHNVSTRFNDGFQVGQGGEIGISTNKLHHRGPVGLDHLTLPKYVAYAVMGIRNAQAKEWGKVPNLEVEHVDEVIKRRSMEEQRPASLKGKGVETDSKEDDLLGLQARLLAELAVVNDDLLKVIIEPLGVSALVAQDETAPEVTLKDRWKSIRKGNISVEAKLYDSELTGLKEKYPRINAIPAVVKEVKALGDKYVPEGRRPDGTYVFALPATKEGEKASVKLVSREGMGGRKPIMGVPLGSNAVTVEAPAGQSRKAHR